MLGSIRKFSKSFVAKIFIALIALPFVMWGMGDVFTSGKQNVLVEINNEKISSKEFIEYIQKIELSKKEIENIGKSKIFEDILTNYISEKIISIEGEKKGIQLSDEALKKILLADKTFQKDERFSRVKYEKFLLENGYTAPTYEKFIKNIELKAQLLNYYSGGIRLPEFIVDDIYMKENKIKEIEYLDLSKIYSKKVIKDKDIKDFYEKNKNFFEEEFISFRYLELTPEILTKKQNIDEEYYEKLDKLENDILDGKKFEDLTSDNNNNINKFELINSRKTKENGTVVKNIDEILFEKIFSIKEINFPSFINFNNKFFIAEVTEKKNIVLNLQDKDLQKTISSQLKIRFKLNENKKYIDEIKNKKINENKFQELSKVNDVPLQRIKINGIKDTKKFTAQFLKKIYAYNSKEIFLMSDNILNDNYLVRILSDTNPKINKSSKEYKDYSKKANAEYISKVYKSYDKYINSNYKIDINDRVLERLKNSF